MQDHEEDIYTKWFLLTVNAGQSVTLLQGVVQKEPVLAFVMGAHARVGRDSSVLLLDRYPELLRLVCSFAGIWRELTPGVAIRAQYPDDTASYYITTDSECSDRCFRRLCTEMSYLTNTHTARFLDHFALSIEIPITTDPVAFTWTEPEIL